MATRILPRTPQLRESLRALAASWYATPVVVLLFGLLSVGVLVWSDQASSEQTVQAFLRDHALSQVETRTAISHIWLEEYLSGDPSIDVPAALADLDHAIGLILLLLRGGELEPGGPALAPLHDPELRQRAIQLEARMAELKHAAVERVSHGDQAGTVVDQAYDQLFHQLLDACADLRQQLKARWRHQQSQAGVRLATIVAVWLVLVGLAVAGLWSREQRRRRTEIALRTREAELRKAQKMEAVGRLAGGIAHDINNFLGAIRGYCEIAKLKGESGQALAARMDGAIATTESISALVQQLLAFSRRQPIAPQVVDLNQVVRGLSGMIQHLIGEAIHLETQLDHALWPITMDPSQLEQVLLNLVVNARDAMPQGGTLAIITDNLTHTASGRHARLTVRDSGCGIPPEVQDQIFEPFFSTKDRHERSGLGLSTVYGIVQQNHGSIEVESALGQGTTFRIAFPAASDTAKAANGQAAVAASAEPRTTIPTPADAVPGNAQPARSIQIVLVEDNPAMRTATVDLLTALGHQVREAKDGHQALQWLLAEQAPTDLLITDVVMPDMTGKELVDRLQAQRPEIPCLFISGYTDQISLRHDLNSNRVSQNRVDFLAKPFAAADLARKIDDLLPQPPAALGFLG